MAAFLFGKPQTATPVGSKLGYSYLKNTSQGTRLDVPPVDFIEDELFQYDAKSVFPSLVHDLALMRWQGRTAKLQLQLSRETCIQYLPGPIGPTYRTRDTMLSVKPCCSQRSCSRSLVRTWHPSCRDFVNTVHERCAPRISRSMT